MQAGGPPQSELPKGSLHLCMPTQRPSSSRTQHRSQLAVETLAFLDLKVGMNLTLPFLTSKSGTATMSCSQPMQPRPLGSPGSAMTPAASLPACQLASLPVCPSARPPCWPGWPCWPCFRAARLAGACETSASHLLSPISEAISPAACGAPGPSRRPCGPRRSSE